MMTKLLLLGVVCLWCKTAVQAACFGQSYPRVLCYTVVGSNVK